MRWCTKIDKYQVCCSKASLSCIVNAPQSGLTLWKSLSLERSKPDRRYHWLFLAQSFFSASASFFRRIAFFGVVELFLAPRLAPRHPRQIILLFNHCSVTKNSGMNKPWVKFSNKESLTCLKTWNWGWHILGQDEGTLCWYFSLYYDSSHSLILPVQF